MEKKVQLNLIFSLIIKSKIHIFCYHIVLNDNKNVQVGANPAGSLTNWRPES
jgi:hypothetical protein